MSRQNKPSSIKTLLINNKAPFQFVEAYKTLRTNLQFSDIDQTVNKLIVTSSLPGEGKSTVSINLAISLAQLGKTVLLVDTDLRKPLIHKYLHLSGVKNGGVTTALT
ncbi:MAG TPA: P-loop NTPase, partial [Clostridia bacterium]|nr:P-loop NTPase [Clostridia bacterium]